MSVWGALGCEPTQRVVRDDWALWADQMRASGAAVEVGGRSGPRGDRGGVADRGPSFAVLLAMHGGDDRRARGLADADWARRQGIAHVWLVEGDELLSVYAGRFGSADDPAAVRTSERARTIERPDGERPFAEARPVPLLTADAVASGDPYDLRTYSGEYEYTVQIGFFDAAYGDDRVGAAEAWVDQLRDEGERAFFYHGPHRSMVTVGLFTQRDFVWEPSVRGDGMVQVPGPKIRELREKYPHNLGNGMTLIQRNRQGESLGEQPSSVVRLP